VVAGQTTTCTFTNLARANLHVLKTAERDGTFDFTSSTLTPAAFSLVANSGVDQDFEDLLPGGYDVAETVPAGWNLETSSCDNGNDPATITLAGGDDVTCTFHNVIERGAIDISKVAKDAANGGTKPLEGVVFTVTGGTLPAAGVTATTDAAGKACVSGLPVSILDGDYTVTETVPAGYAPVEAQVVSVVESTCDTAAAIDASFVNVPLTNVTISVDSQVPGGTASEISCTSAKGTSNGSTDATGDGSVTVTDLLPTDPAVTITCTVIIDP